MRGLVWHGHIALWHDNGKIRLRAPSRSEVPEMEAWRGGREGRGGVSGGTDEDADSGERASEV